MRHGCAIRNFSLRRMHAAEALPAIRKRSMGVCDDIALGHRLCALPMRSCVSEDDIKKDTLLRGTPRETSGYGFVRPSSSRTMIVEDFKGKKKRDGASLRKGIASQLKRLSKGCKKLLRDCERGPGSCFGEGFLQTRADTCGY